MSLDLLDSVILLHDIPAHDLRAGDRGAVVEVYAPDAVEVEFFSPEGETIAVVTISPAEVRRFARAQPSMPHDLAQTSGS
jgi:predicted urease superfamily metal-dependent hydrolase